jgi:hypothetical protein
MSAFPTTRHTASVLTGDVLAEPYTSGNTKNEYV